MVNLCNVHCPYLRPYCTHRSSEKQSERSASVVSAISDVTMGSDEVFGEKDENQDWDVSTPALLGLRRSSICFYCAIYIYNIIYMTVCISPYSTMRFLYFVLAIQPNANEMYIVRR